MNSKERMRKALNLQQPDRVPLMCQLALGHYFLNTGIDPLDIWFTSDGFAEALIALQKRYGFDGILVNLPGREPNYTSYIDKIEKKGDRSLIRWLNGNYTVFPEDDNPHYFLSDDKRPFPTFEEIRPENLFYVEPWDVTEITYPFTWGFESEARPVTDFFPEYHFDTINNVVTEVGDVISVHSEVFSPWSQFLELLNYESALLAMLEDAGKVRACLERLTEGAVQLALKQAACGVDAILISSAFAGAGFISPKHYLDFVLPFEKRLISEVKKQFSLPIYTHTCGSIGDRLDLMLATGTNGIDTLDPPPLGTVDLEEAKQLLLGKTFIKGNIDPVNTLLYGEIEKIKKDVEWRIKVGKPGGGYILSSACSVAPQTPPQNIELLASLADEYGKYS
ncbi:MAG: uroporphyrinogen decarboxylase family protein [bacterium]